MTASNPISAQDKGELPPIVPAAIQMPKAIIPIEIVNECSSSDNLRPIRHFENGGSGSSGVRV
jgi:hypothetical protein